MILCLSKPTSAFLVLSTYINNLKIKQYFCPTNMVLIKLFDPLGIESKSSTPATCPSEGTYLIASYLKNTKLIARNREQFVWSGT
jgi:hypothetical protein